MKTKRKTPAVRLGRKNTRVAILFICVALIPALSHLAIFWAPVQIQSLILSFVDYRTNSFTLFGNFASAIEMLTDGASDLGSGMLNTCKFFLVGLALKMLSFFAAYMLYKKMFGSAFVRTVLYLPAAVSSFMMAYIYQQVLISEGPLITFLTQTLGIEMKLPVIVESAMPMMIFYQIWLGLGGGLIVWFGAMGRIPPDILDYGKLDGIGPFREFFSIIIPLIWPTFVTLFTLDLIGFFGADGPILLFTEGRYGTFTLGYWLFDVVYSGSRNMYGVAMAVGLLMTFATIPVVFIARYIMNRFGQEVEY